MLNDLAAMLPHGRKDAKFDSKSKLYQLNELAEISNCNNVLFFEARKGQDLYVWLSKVPNGPTVKMHLQNLHTMEGWSYLIQFHFLSILFASRRMIDLLANILLLTELHFTGNCLKGSRPVLSFDAAFDKEPYLQVIKELFLHTFGVPQGARKSKPFIDHVMGFTFADGKIWIRNYEIKETEASKSTDEDAEAESKASKGRSKELDINMVEIGPRFVLTPIIIQEGSFGGPIIYENKEFVSPNQVRADLRKRKATKHNARAEQFVERLAKKGDLGLRTSGGKPVPVDELDTKQLFA